MSNLTSIFEEIAESTRSSDNPIFRFETLVGTFTFDSNRPSRRYSQREVKAIEMQASNDHLSARLFLDLEDGPLPYTESGKPARSRSRLEVQGEEDAVFEMWEKVMAIVAFRGSVVAKAMQAGLVMPLAIGLALAVVVLAVFTIDRLRLHDPFASGGLFISILLGAVAAVSFVAMSQVLFPRVSVEGWGRYERMRAGIQWWAGGILAGLVAWAIGLGIQWYMTG